MTEQCIIAASFHYFEPLSDSFSIKSNGARPGEMARWRRVALNHSDWGQNKRIGNEIKMAKLVRGPKFGRFPGSDFRSRVVADCKWREEMLDGTVEAAKWPADVFVKIETRTLSEHDFPKLAVTQQLQQRSSYLPPPSLAVGPRPAHLIILNPRDYRNGYD